MSAVYPIMRKYLFALLTCLMAWTPVQAAEPCLPFVGERLVFSVGWEFINAGTATMIVSEPEAGYYSIQTDARTNAFLDMFKKVRDRIVSEGRCVDGRMQSALFMLNQHERRYRALKTSVFDRVNAQVRYTENDKTDIYPVSAEHINVMDAFFTVRAMDLKPGQEIHLPVFDSRKVYDVVVRIGKKHKRIRAPWGKYVECISIEPQLKTEGIFSSPGRMKIWVTDDARHIPLKLVAKIKIGHIIGRLIQYQEPL